MGEPTYVAPMVTKRLRSDIDASNGTALVNRRASYNYFAAGGMPKILYMARERSGDEPAARERGKLI